MVDKADLGPEIVMPREIKFVVVSVPGVGVRGEIGGRELSDEEWMAALKKWLTTPENEEGGR